ncbi:COG4223 family protein [Nisaea denitrificans]|uniref:COG4223 family protein n=1 Tax=Nisaea denitrificans TaxID=390877 RepID=UPI0004243497|nr:mitofilin family membrane protein [Nisaea denitrificans]
MTDPKSQTGEKNAGETNVADATVIDVEPTRVSEDAADGAAKKSGLSLRTKLIGFLILLVIIAGGVAAALYPLWRDRADALVSQSGLPLALPEVPDNEFYGTVDDVIAFFQGETSDAAPDENTGTVAVSPAPEAAPEPVVDPLTVLATRLDGLETKLGTLAETAQAAQSAAESAAETSAAIAASPQPDEEVVTALAARLERLEQRLDGLEARPLAAAAEGGSEAAAVNEALLNLIGSLRERIVSLEARETVAPSDLETVTSRIETAESGAGARIAGLEADLETVRQLAEKRAPQRERAGLLLLAVGQLEAATSTSGSFAPQLASVKDLVIGEPAETVEALSVLEGHGGGVESVTSLSQRFNDLAKAVSQAKLAGSDEGLVGKTLNTVASLVTIRRTDVAEGPGVDAILVRAESAVKAGDIAGAVAALEELSGAPAERASAWVAAAKARVAVDQAVARLRGAALASVAEAG